MNTISSEHHPKPVEGQITGSQPSATSLASPQSEGLAVTAPGAEQSAPATDEMDSTRLVLRMAGAMLEQRDKEIAKLRAEALYQHGVILQLASELRAIRGPALMGRAA